MSAAAHRSESAQNGKSESAEPGRTEAAEGKGEEKAERRTESREAQKAEERQTENGPEHRNPARIVRNAGSAPAARGMERKGVRRFTQTQQTAGQAQNHIQSHSSAECSVCSRNSGFGCPSRRMPAAHPPEALRHRMKLRQYRYRRRRASLPSWTAAFLQTEFWRLCGRLRFYPLCQLPSRRE